MENTKTDLAGFIDILIRKSGLNQSELAKAIGIDSQTFTNWRSTPPTRIHPTTLHKIEAYLSKANLGLRLGSISNSTIEVIYIGENPIVEQKTELNKDLQILQDLLNQTLAKLLKAEQTIAFLEGELTKKKHQ